MPSPKSGSPGSASAPTAPTVALAADAADPGEVEKIKAEQRKTQTGKYGKTPGKPHQPPQSEEEKEKQKKKSWIEIKLLDVEGKPVPGEPYRVVLPDQSIAEGSLDQDGFTRIEGFESGNCQVSFPRRDKRSWSPK